MERTARKLPQFLAATRVHKLFGESTRSRDPVVELGRGAPVSSGLVVPGERRARSALGALRTNAQGGAAECPPKQVLVCPSVPSEGALHISHLGIPGHP